MKSEKQSAYMRYCKTMELRNDPLLIEAYKKAHAKGAAWSEITQSMKEVGIIDMEIYLLGTKLFMIMDTVADFDYDKAMVELALKPRQSEWETYMSQFQDSSAEVTADQKWQLIEQIYKMDK